MSAKIKTAVIFVLLSLVAVGINAYLQTKKEILPLSADAAQNFIMGYNLYKHGTLSLALSDSGTVIPTAYREPFYPVVIALMLHLYPGEIPEKVETLLNETMQYRSIHLFVWYNQLIALFMICFAAAMFAYRVTGSIRFSITPLIIINVFIYLFRGNPVSGSPEILAQLLFLLTSLALLHACKRTRAAQAFLCGSVLGLLTLVKAIFSFMLWPVAGMLLYAAWRRRKTDAMQLHAAWYQMLATGLCVIMGYYVLVGPWLLRNHRHFGLWIITNRAEQVLAIRAEYNAMSLREYFISFLWWTPGVDNLIVKYFPYDAYKNLVRENPDGYVKRGRKIRVAFRGGQADDDPVWRVALKQYARNKIIAHPLRHILVTLPMAYRGIFFLHYLSFIVLPFTAVGIKYLVQKCPREEMAFLFPSVYCFCMYAFFSHNIPRYNYPIIPVACILAGIGLQVLWQGLRITAFFRKYFTQACSVQQ